MLIDYMHPVLIRVLHRCYHFRTDICVGLLGKIFVIVSRRYILEVQCVPYVF
jgi:hypothetical protein